jgi:hypothetical protein
MSQPNNKKSPSKQNPEKASKIYVESDNLKENHRHLLIKSNYYEENY